MSNSERTAYRVPVPSPRRPESPYEIGWASPTPLPMILKEDLGKTLKQVLDQFGGMERPLERIEKALMERPPL